MLVLVLVLVLVLLALALVLALKAVDTDSLMDTGTCLRSCNISDGLSCSRFSAVMIGVPKMRIRAREH